MSNQPSPALRDHRTARGWSVADAVRELRTYAPIELPGNDSLIRQWRRREAGNNEPREFYQPIIAAALSVEP